MQSASSSLGTDYSPFLSFFYSFSHTFSRRSPLFHPPLPPSSRLEVVRNAALLYVCLMLDVCKCFQEYISPEDAYIYIDSHTHPFTFTHIYPLSHTSTYTHRDPEIHANATYVNVRTHTSGCTQECVASQYVYVCVCVCVYVCLCLCVCVCICLMYPPIVSINIQHVWL